MVTEAASRALRLAVFFPLGTVGALAVSSGVRAAATHTPAPASPPSWASRPDVAW
ncbi:hypothetical protein VTH06DRAFT_2221 [Thermothelomyces fergusii]